MRIGYAMGNPALIKYLNDVKYSFNSYTMNAPAIALGVPAVKGVEFGAGFAAASLKGSQYNDPYCLCGDEVEAVSNHAGGLLGGMTDCMPLMVRAAFRPTPSISLPQQTVSLKQRTNETLTVKGRHDPCVAVRAVPVVESAVALSLLEMWLERRAAAPVEE